MIRITGNTDDCYCILSYHARLLYMNSMTVIILSIILGRQFELYELRLWWHEVYGIYMRVFLFGLFPRCINLMKPNS